MAYKEDMYNEFEQFKKEHPGCGPADKAIFWEEKANEFADILQWTIGFLVDDK